MAGFFERLAARCASQETFLCVGLDPRASSAAEAEALCVSLIDATHDVACCFKPNAAFFEAHGSAGLEALKRVIAKVHAVGGLALLDCKRATSARATAEAHAWRATTTSARTA
ncbi:orotidine 5'-phosphate decarboxylase [Aureococcus anophagefferens]|uniref:Orotidine 5'-phosphate decarboxylase n=1 Tax=Aureococcus anophagefferens TaxID=44056 RepID=A0ABR1G3A6_AURAN